MSEPNNRRRRRSAYPAPPAADQEHPFLTPHGLQLQQQGQQGESDVPMFFPNYPGEFPDGREEPDGVMPFDGEVPEDGDDALPPPAGQAPLDPFEFELREGVQIHNVLPSRKFPQPEVLGNAPLNSYFQSQRVNDPQADALRSVGKLFIQLTPDTRRGLANGSAWVSGPSILVTCAHNVYDFAKRVWSHAMEFHPAFDDYSSKPRPKCRITSCYIPRGYLSNPAANHDIAVCYTDINIGDILDAFIPMRPVDSNAFYEDNPITIVGYPAGSGFDFGKQMWQSKGDYLFGQSTGGYSDYAPVMATDFGGGASGCPWVIQDSKSGEYAAVGVTSGHAKLRYRRGEFNLTSLVSPFFGPRLFEALENDPVYHDFT